MTLSTRAIDRLQDRVYTRLRMKRWIRSAVTTLLLSTIALAQFPKVAHCQMALNGIFSARCSMPCCQRQSPVPRCPMIKAEAPRDLIASNFTVFVQIVQTAHMFGSFILSYTPKHNGFAENVKRELYTFFSSPPTQDRAPPATIHLLSA